MKKIFGSDLFKNRRMKYGSVAVAFTVIFIAVIILLNAVVTALDNRFGLYADMTSEKSFEIGESSKELLADVTEPVEIIFCRDRDKLISDSYMSRIVLLAEKYAAEFSNISVDYIDNERRGGDLTRFRATTSTTISSTDVIINCPSANKYRKVSRDAFYSVQSSQNTSRYVGFNGEMRFTASILAVTRAANDKIALIYGHDESLSSQMVEVLMNAGYDTEESLVTVDLAKDEIPENTRLVIINNPQKDFNGYEAEKSGKVNEIAKLDRYLKEYGNLFVAVNNTTKDLPELSEYLTTEWGIGFHAGEVVEDDGNSETVDGRSIIARYVTDSENHPYAYEITRRVGSLSARTVMSNTTPLYLSAASRRTVSPILQSSGAARVMNGEKAVSTGAQTLMAISTFMDYPDGKYEKFSHVFVSGSVDFLHTDLTDATANSDLIYSILQIVGTEKVPIDIPARMFSDDTVSGIGTRTFRRVTAGLSAIPALAVLILGTVVFIRRKHL